MSIRRSPQSAKHMLLYHKTSGTHLMFHQQQSFSSSCIRCIRWVLLLMLVSVLSSYATYLALYQAPRQALLGVASSRWHLMDHHAAAKQQHPLDVDALIQQVQPAAAAQADTAAIAAAVVAAGTVAAGGSAAKPLGTAAAKAAAAITVGGQKHVPGQPSPLAPVDAATQWVKATGRRMTVALVNEAPYHLEIVAGFLTVLKQLPVDVTWYQAGQSTPEGGVLTPVELLEMQGFTQLLGYLPHMRPSSDKPDPVDFALFISPEYFEKETAAFLKAAKPITAVILAHNGMNHALQRIQEFHPRLHFAALAPHVAAASQQVLHIQMHWMMATFPFAAKNPCLATSPDAATCLHGFSIQGNFESARRNYTRLWQQVEAAHASGLVPTQPPVKPFHLHLVGRGSVRTLGILPSVANLSTVHFNLQFPAYYEQLYRTHALLMLLGSKNYLLQKMSSTIVSSLMTGVPIIADSKVLASYTFLNPEHVHLMAPQETEMDVMQRVLRMSPAEVFAVRQQVVELAKHLNRRTLQVLQTFMPMVGDIHAAPAVV
eukprot:GHRR01003684.1.p1 GENE.GHRR01003684.1~~GHRR01003684.1.p1  ORF type:complete len:543 (+),score=179.83 GHRR01003684.1:546-2174(+)